MVNFNDGELKDIIPYNLLTKEVQAVSYAVGEEKRILKRYSAASSLQAAINQVPEAVLDLMAIELNTQYYEQTLPREIKEKMIFQTLKWYMRAGTPSVLSELLETVLDGGYTEEWHEYGGAPYHFKAYAFTGNHEIPLGYGEEIKRRIETYKNVRSWLEFFMFITQIKCRAETIFRSALTFSTKFYARGDVPLKLDGKWKLNRRRKLSRFEADSNWYPSAVSFTLPATAATMESSQMDFKTTVVQDWRVMISAGFQQPCRLEPEIKKSLTISIGAETKAGLGGIGITVINQLDGKWKLNGTERKLNGGLYPR